MSEWKPGSAEVRWSEPPSERLDGTEWPKEVTLIAWERSDEGERRVRAKRVYRLTEGTDR